MTVSAQTYIETLCLQIHPEGGFFRETYRSDGRMTVAGTANDPVQRNICTCIYFLMEKGNFSAFHQLKSDEMWHFYAGQALEVLELKASGELLCTRLGPDILNGDLHQYVVPANTWFASRVAAGGDFSLVGCTVAPGFDFADFKLADRSDLLARFPQHAPAIVALTRRAERRLTTDTRSAP
ncbi:MAG: cupin domain-containing protein [Comamonadaceae bacterium]|nr:cupin domain-containing protein [Comamonadaceae bacterium]